MGNLLHKQCVPCEGGVSPFTGAALQSFFGQVNVDWKVVEDGKKIRREFKFPSFMASVAFINRVAEVAESERHHPDIHCYYRKVELVIWTHAIGGLSENDFILAAKVDRIV